MRVEEISIDKIHIPENRARATFTEEQYNELKASIEKNGFTIPILVRDTGKGFFELIDGEHRIQVARELGYKKIPAVITEADDKRATLLNILANTARGTQNPMDVAEALKKAYDAGADIEELAAATGHTKSWVKLYLTLNDLPDNYKDALRHGKLKVGHIQEAMKLMDPVEIDAALQSALQLEWPVSTLKYYVERRLEELRKLREEGNVEEPPAPPTPSQAQELVQYGNCLFCNRLIPRRELRMPVMCDDCYNLLDYVVSQLGDPRQAMQTIYDALTMYFAKKKHVKETETKEKEEKAVSVSETTTQQSEDTNISAEDLKLIKLIKLLKNEGII